MKGVVSELNNKSDYLPQFLHDSCREATKLK